MTNIEHFYDELSKNQIKAGVHKRHLMIVQWIKHHGLLPNHRVLEVGCGVGTVTGLMASYLKSGTIIANDISKKSIEIAKNRLKQFKNISFLAGDIMKIGLKEKVNAIILPDVLEHIPIEVHPQLFAKLNSYLVQDGFLFIHIPNPFYIEWVKENEPHLLQIVDQPIHLEIIAKVVKEAGFYFDYLKTYSIWNVEPDYQVIILRKSENVKKFRPLAEEKANIFQRGILRILSKVGLTGTKLPV